MKRIGNNHVSFYGQRCYDVGGNLIEGKKTYNILVTLGYQHVKDIQGLRRIIPITKPANQ